MLHPSAAQTTNAVRGHAGPEPLPSVTGPTHKGKSILILDHITGHIRTDKSWKMWELTWDLGCVGFKKTWFNQVTDLGWSEIDRGVFWLIREVPSDLEHNMGIDIKEEPLCFPDQFTKYLHRQIEHKNDCERSNKQPVGGDKVYINDLSNTRGILWSKNEVTNFQ